MEELKRFQASTFETIARRRLVEDQDNILELTGKIQELQNEINCMDDSRDFQDAESVRSGHSHVTSQPVSFPLHPVLGGMLSRSIGMPSRKDGPPSIWDTWYIGKRFCKSSRVFFSTLSAGVESMEVQNIRTSPHVMSENQTPVQDQRCQSAPSAKNSVIPSEGDSSKKYGADQHRLQISDLHFDKFPTPATFVCWKIRLETEVCTCSLVPTEDMLWIKEVEMVDSVDDLKSSSSVRGIRMPDFEVFDANIASHFNRRFSLEEQKSTKRGPFPSRKTGSLTWSTSTSESLEPMIPSRIMPTCLLLVYEMMIFRNSILSGTEFYYQSMTKDSTWWHLGRIVQIKNTRVWEAQDRIGIAWPVDSSEESRT